MDGITAGGGGGGGGGYTANDSDCSGKCNRKGIIGHGCGGTLIYCQSTLSSFTSNTIRGERVGQEPGRVPDLSSSSLRHVDVDCRAWR